MADWIAEVYVLWKGKKPTYGTRQVKDPSDLDEAETITVPSTVFGRVTEEVFHLLGIDSGLPGPCKAAIANLMKSDAAKLNALLSKRERFFRSLRIEPPG